MENQNDINNSALEFDFKKAADNHSIIKVVGVGGGGSNAVQHMYEAGIQDVSFLIINTDKQALKGSAIPSKLLIGEKGLGAGAKPEIAREYAEQYAESIREALSDGTEMVFITAGMGGGTGTGAAPVVAKIAHDMGILTVGIVTIPFRFEGKKKIMMALDGVRSIEKWCDALLVVNNNRLIDIYPDLTFGNAFGKADDTLTTAAKSISDIINKQGYINLDFADVSTTLRNGGVALISTGTARGERRLSNAIDAAKISPLLQDNKITDAKHLLFELCFSHQNPLSMSEIAEMNAFVDTLNGEIEVIWGAMYDDELGDDVRIILLASGFAMDHSTGGVMARDKMGDRTKEMQTLLRNAIVERQGGISEFEGYPDAEAILLEAFRKATQKADEISLDDSIDDEISKLDIALEKARQKMQEEEDRKQAALAAAEEERRKKILAQIEELQNQLPTPEAPAPAEVAAPAVPSSQPSAESSHPAVPSSQPSAESSHPAVLEPTIFTDTLEAPEEVTPAAVPPAVPSSQPSAESHPTPLEVAPPRPADTPKAGIDEVRRYYGEEAANKMLLDDTRKAYYLLDEQDLTNEELIALLEKLPAYNRSLEDLGQLRVINRKPAQPKVIGRHD